jgi:hypothetical protein
MQHHGAPTRLLDCTYSPFIAAQNAVKDGVQTDKDGNPLCHVVWCFRATEVIREGKAGKPNEFGKMVKSVENALDAVLRMQSSMRQYMRGAPQ